MRTLLEEKIRIIQIMGYNNKLFESILTESEISAKKLQNTGDFVVSNGIKIFGAPHSREWNDQIYAISATAGNSFATLNDFFEKFDFSLLISQKIVPVFYEEDDRCNLEYFMSFDEETINGRKEIRWQNNIYELTFESDNVSRSSRGDNMRIRDMAEKILNRLEYDMHL